MRVGTIHYTPTEKRMLELLSDGKPHTRKEMHGCLWDEHSELTAIQIHISKIRHKLLTKGETIICELSGYRICYRHVRLINSSASS